MEYVEGRIFVDIQLAALSPDEREQVMSEVVKVLARLHNFDYNAVGLGSYANTGKNYFERQIKTWTMAYRATETEQIKLMDELIAWLPEN
jgi:aminoglycoside phosphotransferase (APT) family kinase protein